MQICQGRQGPACLAYLLGLTLRSADRLPRSSHRGVLGCVVSPGLSVFVPRLASRVTVAVRPDARDVIYLSIYLPRSGFLLV